MAEFVYSNCKDGFENFDILNSNKYTLDALFENKFVSPEKYETNKYLKDKYGISANPFALTLVRLIAFTHINNRIQESKTYSSPQLLFLESYNRRIQDLRPSAIHKQDGKS